MTTDSNTLLQIRNLQTVFPSKGQLVKAVETVNLDLKQGEILGVVGESGCGKSTLLLSIMRLLRYPGKIANGEVYFRGTDLTKISEREMRDLRGKEMAMIFQDPLSTLNPAFSIG
ncbi:MAG: ATP-binding cassette domain-containing protein, partial [Anaerolineales bacterium]